MDLFMETLATILSDNFWLLLLVFLMYADKDTRLGAVLLAAMRLLFGFDKWAFIFVVFITYATNYLRPNDYYRNKYKKKLKRYKRMSEIESETNDDEITDDENICHCDNGSEVVDDRHEIKYF